MKRKYHILTDMSRPPRPFKHKNGIFYIRMRIHGRDVWRSLHTNNRRDAEILAYNQWYALQQPEARAILRLPDTLLETVWQDYAGSDDYKLLEISTQHTKLKRWNQFIKFCAEMRLESFDDITPDIAESFLNTCGTAGKTFNNARGDLIKAFSVTCRRYNRDNPFEAVQCKTTSRGDGKSSDYRAFTDDEVKKILDAIRSSGMKYASEWYTACQIALYTGLRYKDIALLSWFAVKQGYIETIPHKTASKTGKSVLIRICPQLKNVLDFISHESEYLLPRLAESYLESLEEIRTSATKTLNETDPFNRLLSRLEITGNGQKIGFHSFRSTVITKLRAAGIDAKLIGGMVGHTTEKQTEHYNKNALEIDVSCLQYA